MDILRTRQDLRGFIQRLRVVGKRVALVPTMGALHAGHISLVEQGRRKADSVIATIFVNPSQFGPNEDFSRYPRTEAEDCARLEAVGSNAVYIPDVSQMYRPDAATFVHVRGISGELCGAVRPGHFDGVATIVTKLFMQALPDYAVFGEKDWQQLHIIRKMTMDLDIPVQILSAPILREESGLAMSSRNRYLSEAERATAARLYAILLQTCRRIKEGREVDALLEEATRELLAAGFDRVDYVELRDSVTLQTAESPLRPARLLAAVHLGNTRLIDNVELA